MKFSSLGKEEAEAKVVAELAGAEGTFGVREAEADVEGVEDILRWQSGRFLGAGQYARQEGPEGA